MSYYLAFDRLKEWALSPTGLKLHLDKDDYSFLYDAITDGRLRRIPVAMLKVLYERDTGSPGSTPTASMSRAVTKEEMASIVCCHASAVRKNANRINAIVVRGAAPGTWAKRFGLIWRNEYGIGIHLGLIDAQAARNMSTTQIAQVTKAHRQNLAIVDEAEGESTQIEEQRRKFDSLSPSQRARLLHSVGA